MKFNTLPPLKVLLLYIVLVFQFSCAKDSDLLTDYIIAEKQEDLSGIDLENSKLLPTDFDWNTIPADYSNSVWEITEFFDLEGASITLPENVTLYFNGGSLANGVVTGDAATIISKTKYQVFEGIDLAGTFVEEQYIMPYWFGAVMDGITDDRDAFVATLAHANTLGLKVLVDRDIYLDVEETGTKSIFLEDNTWIEGANGANIIINNLLSPAFYMVLTKDVTIKNLTFLYDQTYDATFGWNTSSIERNLSQLRDYMTVNKDIKFTSSMPLWNGGPVSFRAMFSIDASNNIEFNNVKLMAKGETADTFIQEAIKLKEQFTENQTVANGIGTTKISNNIRLTDVTMDGVLMGIQGIVEDLTINGLRSYRYSDVQDRSGNNIGGTDYWMPPPHLIYLNKDSSTAHYSQNIKITNTIDYGIYVGTTNIRPSVSGYCNSLKLVDYVENVVVDNYKSYRRDGLGDLGGILNGVFKNIYAESTIGIFDPTFKFNSLRFVGPLTNTSIENMTIKDNSDVLEIYPLDFTLGDNVTMDNVHVYVNELKAGHGPFGISGSNNKIVNSSLTIQKHTTTQEYRGVIYHDNATMDTGKNNYFDIQINGWRTIDSDPIKKSIRVLLASSSNSNTNYAKVTDTRNNFVIEQTNAVKKDTWSRSEVAPLGDGNSQLLNINIPNGFAVHTITATTLENLASGIEVSIGTGSTRKEDLLGAVSKTIGVASKTMNESIVTSGTKTIYLYANGDFNNTGKIEVSLELVRVSEYD